jgi:hypothetical protein
MPILNAPVHDHNGPVIDLLIGVSEARRTVLLRNNFLVPARLGISALVDTGSKVSGVDPSILKQLDLRPISQQLIYTASTIPGQPYPCDEYDVSLFIPHDRIEMYLTSVAVIATNFLPEENVQALIGRDVLAHCYFAYDGLTSTFVLAF